MDDHCEDHSAHELAIGSYGKRLDAHGEQIDALTENLIELKQIAKQNADSIERMDRRVAALEAKPGRRWDSLVEKALLVVCAAVVGYALGLVGIG